jgi:hypothetical protein
MINDEIALQILDVLKEKTAQAQTQEKKLIEKFQALAGEVEKVHKVQVAQDEPHVSVGVLLDAGLARKTCYFLGKACGRQLEEKTTCEEKQVNTHARKS